MFKKWMFLIPLLFVSFASYASYVDVFLSGGTAFSRLSNNTSIQINDFVTNNYVTNRKTNAGPLAAIGIGHTFEKICNHPFSIALALTGYYVNLKNIDGTEYLFVNAGQFDTLDYRFKANTLAAMLESRFIYAQYVWRPFILLGAGTSWNRLYDYQERPTDPASTAAPVSSVFGSNTKTSFAYEFGIGVQYLLPLVTDNENKVKWLLSLDYRYMNFGRGEFASSPLQTIDDPLKINNLNTQALVFTLLASIY